MLFRLTIIIALGLLLAGCNAGSVIASVTPGAFQAVWAGVDWVAAYGQGVQAVALANNLCYFDFPVAPGHVDYLIKAAPPLALNKTISAQFTIAGEGKIVPGPNSGNPPAKVRLFFQRAGDDFSGTGPAEFYRWWSVNFIDLSAGAGDYTLSEVLSPDRWTSVFGKSGAGNEAAFADCINNAANVGVTFGADFAGHGDAVEDGPMRFTFTAFGVA